MLEQGREQLHQPVLWIVHEYMVKLAEGGQVDLAVISQNIISIVSNLLKVCETFCAGENCCECPPVQTHLWQDALAVLTLAVKSSSTLVQPPTPHLPMVDIGFFRQSLPGPTLKFSMDLTPSSMDLSLAQSEGSFSKWQRPQGCQVRLVGVTLRSVHTPTCLCD